MHQVLSQHISKFEKLRYIVCGEKNLQKVQLHMG